jgi:hypothetical protein
MIESSELDLTSVPRLRYTTKNMDSENVFKWVILRVLLAGLGFYSIVAHRRILPPRSRNTNRRHNETVHADLSVYPSQHAVLVTGSGRACKTSGCSIFTSLHFLLLSRS